MGLKVVQEAQALVGHCFPDGLELHLQLHGQLPCTGEVHSSLSFSMCLFCDSKHHMSGIADCPLDIWWLIQKISKHRHDAVVFQELLAMETQGHLRGHEKRG